MNTAIHPGLYCRLALAGLLACGLCACQSVFAPAALKHTHPAYNQAIIGSLNQELLTNVVRLRYYDTPFFLRISSVTSSINVSASAGLGACVPLAAGGESLSPSLGLSYSHSPTLTLPVR